MRGPVRSRSLRLTQALGVRCEQRDHAQRQRHRQRGAEREPAECPKKLVGVDSQASKRCEQDHDRDLERDVGAVGERLDGQVALAERPEIAETGKHCEPLSRDEHVHEHDRQCHERDRAQGAGQLAPHARADGRR